MAENHRTTPTSNADLASRLIDHADSITNIAAHEMESDIRDAARRLREIGEPPRLRATLPSLHFELDRIATACPHTATVEQLRTVMGDKS